MARPRKMATVTSKGSRLEMLKNLSLKLAKELDNCDDQKTLAPLVRQYRETLKEIEEIEGAGEGDDEIGSILSGRQADGKPGAVRTDRAGVPGI